MVQISLRSSARKFALWVLLLLPGVLYSAMSIRCAIADHFANKLTVEGLRTAVTLEPNNANYHYRLGRMLYLMDSDSDESLKELSAATRLNPREAQFWIELSLVQQLRGNRQEQEFAITKALEADPTTPDVAWVAANLDLVADQTERALGLFRVVIQNDPSNASRAIDLAWRATGDIDLMLNRCIPNTPEANSEFLAVLADRQETAAARKVWERLVSLKSTIAPSPAFKYVDLLVASDNAAAADAAWAQLTSSNPDLRYYAKSANLVVNGSFEYPFLNRGLDWHWIKWDSRYVPSIDSTEAFNGAASLSFEVHSRSLDDFGLSQLVPVRPSSEYHFSGMMRSEELLTASGPRFVVRDANTDEILLATEEVIGTAQWREYGGSFSTNADTSLLSIRVERLPGNQVIAGKFWVDNIQLTSKEK